MQNFDPFAEFAEFDFLVDIYAAGGRVGRRFRPESVFELVGVHHESVKEFVRLLNHAAVGPGYRLGSFLQVGVSPKDEGRGVRSVGYAVEEFHPRGEVVVHAVRFEREERPRRASPVLDRWQDLKHRNTPPERPGDIAPPGFC